MKAINKKVAIQIASTVPMDDIIERCVRNHAALSGIADIFEVGANTEDDFIDAVRDVDAIITTWGMRIGKKIILQLDHCSIISVGSVGVDMVDVEAATEAGIVVTNVPDIYIEEVADHTLLLILSAARHIKEMGQLVCEGKWFKGRPILSSVPRLWGQNLGLVGFGNVARAVTRRAKGFGFNIIAFDPYVSELKMTAEGVEPVSFEELLTRSDYISIHSLLNEETYHMISTREFKMMKNTASIVNTARGPLIDEAALIDALKNSELSCAALDVLEIEPPDLENPLLQMPNVILTPHVASATARMRPEAMRRVCSLERWQPYSMERGPNR